jgi:hypothetical protein
VLTIHIPSLSPQVAESFRVSGFDDAPTQSIPTIDKLPKLPNLSVTVLYVVAIACPVLKLDPIVVRNDYDRG